MSAARRWREADGEHVDVRGLAPPAPLVEILSVVDALRAHGAPAGAAVIVHHDRDPRLLHPELAERGWGADALDAPAGEVRLRLTPLPPR